MPHSLHLDVEKDAKDGSKISMSVETKLSAPESTIQPLPEGGFWAWSTVLGAWLMQFSTFGYVNAFGAYQDFYVREYLTNSTPSEIGWIGGVQICFTFSMGVFTGRLFDRGYFYWLNGCSLVLYAIAVFMLSLSNPNHYYQVFLAHGIAFGLACGLAYTPSLGITSHYFLHKRALAIGIVSSGSALGAIIHPIMLNSLFSSSIGFHNGVRISGAMNVSLLIIANCLMRTRLPPHRAAGSSFSIPFKQYLSDLPYLYSLMGCICAFLGLFFVVFYLQLYAVLHGIDEGFAFYSLAILNAASIFGRILPGFFSPRFGPLNLSIICAAGTGITTACLAAVNSKAGVIIYAICFGFISGAVIAISPATMVSLIEDHKEYGTRLGIFFFFGGLAGLVATPISGALLTTEYHWLRASLFAGVFCFIPAFANLIARSFVVKRKGTTIV